MFWAIERPSEWENVVILIFLSGRIKIGLQNAKRKGKELGAKIKLNPMFFQKGLELKNQGLSNRQIAKNQKSA